MLDSAAVPLLRGRDYHHGVPGVVEVCLCSCLCCAHVYAHAPTQEPIRDYESLAPAAHTHTQAHTREREHATRPQSRSI